MASLQPKRSITLKLLQALSSVRGPSAKSQPPRDIAAQRDAMLLHGLTPQRAHEMADALEAEGRLLEAIDVLTLGNRVRRSVDVERRLARLRHAAFATLDRSLPPPEWPPFVPEDPPEVGPWPPEIPAARLTPGLLRTGIFRHGSVLVRGLIPPSRVARLRDTIDRAFDAYDATVAGRATDAMAGWFDPVEDLPNGRLVRDFGRKGQGVFAADSPRALYELLESIYEVGLNRVIERYMGERPSLSVEKTTFRRVDTATQHPEWHQDGAFLGKGVRTVNAWIALSHCGRDAPGLDVIPTRFDRVLPTGVTGPTLMFFDWAVSVDTIFSHVSKPTVWRPAFEPGDVLLFDHLTLHRTAQSPDMPKVRYAVECWFFASSVYPDTSTPVVV